MKTDSNIRGSKGFGSRLVQGIKNSLIVSGLDKLCIKVYELLCGGAFARLFGGMGKDKVKSESCEVCAERRGFMKRFCDGVSQRIESSSLVRSITRCAGSVFGLRTRVIGTYLLTFAAYTAVIAFIMMLVKGTVAATFSAISGIGSAVIMALSAIPFAICKGTLSDVLTASKFFKGLVRLLGFNENKIWSEEIRGKHLTAFILGTVSGLATIAVDPLVIFVVIAALLYVYLVLSVPEFGVMCIAFLMPFIPTMALAGLTIFVSIAFVIKLIRGKRILSFARIDFFVALFAVMILLAGVVSHSLGSLAPAFLFVCFLAAYFIVSCCINSGEWIRRIIYTSVTSAMVVALYGIVQYAFGTFGANAWLDSDLFEGISGRAISTLENPNMLGEYLIMILPMALSLFMAKGENTKKYTFMCTASMGMCLILTWSRGAWLGFIFSMVIFLLIWNKRSMWLFAGGLLALPVLPIILPDSIISRFTSIGNLADTSTSYRVHVWRGAVHMLRDNFFNGIGVGEAAWYELYPEYSLSGIEAAPHSHNLFIQIALEQGVFGLVVFLVILFLLLRMSFNLFARMSSKVSELGEKAYYNTRLLVAGPICGLAGVLLQGLTDYSWYNYRVYLMFWLVLALIPALVKHSSRELEATRSETAYALESSDEASVDIRINND